MIKPFLYSFCVAAVLLSACQKESEELPAPGSAGELSFNLSVDGMAIADTQTATRAAGADADLQTYGFFLAGYHTEGLIADKAATAVPNVFDKEKADQQLPVPLVSYKDNKFTLKTIKWALDDRTYLSFFGWSQNKAYPTTADDGNTTGIIRQTFNANDKGYPWLEVRNANAPADQTDVVGSRSIDHKNDAVLSAVDLDFLHLLSKLTFKAKSSSKAKATITGANIVYATDKVYKKARYTFGSSPVEMGAWGVHAEYQSGTVVLTGTSQTISAGSTVALGSMLLIPQALEAGAVSIELKYKISPGGTIEGPEQTKTLPLSAFTPEQGKNYAFTIDIRATGITIIGDPVVEPWNVASTTLPLVPGPKDGKTLLLLDGYDKPYQHVDGKWYWLDRSGYNRHVKLTDSYKSYDAVNHAYVFDAFLSDPGGIVPSLGTVGEVTFDVIAESTRSDSKRVQSPFTFNDFELQSPVSGGGVEWHFRANQFTLGSIRWNVQSLSDITRKTYWTTTCNASSSKIYYNASLKASETKGIPSDAQVNGNKLADTYTGSIYYLRVTNKERTITDIVGNYKEAKERYNIIEPSSKYLPPVTDGLMFCYDGRSGVETINGVNYWRDQVGKADMKIAANGWIYNSALKCFTNASGTNNPMSAVYNGVILPNSFTVELLLKPNGNSEGAPVAWGTNPANGTSTRSIFMHFPYSTGSIIIDTPGVNRYSFSWPTGVGGTTDSRKVVIRRKYQTISEFFMANKNVVPSSSPGKADADMAIQPCDVMDIGYKGWGGNIYALRIYNRPLTDEEMKTNYDFDHTTFNLQY